MADYDFETDLQNQHERNNAESDDFVQLDPDTGLQAESIISNADDREEAEEDLYPIPSSTHMHVSGFNSTDRPLGTFDDIPSYSHHDDFLPEPEEEHPLPDSTERPPTPEIAASNRPLIDYDDLLTYKEVYQPPPPSAPPAEPEQSKMSTFSEGGWIDLKSLDPRDVTEQPSVVQTEVLIKNYVYSVQDGVPRVENFSVAPAELLHSKSSTPTKDFIELQSTEPLKPVACQRLTLYETLPSPTLTVITEPSLSQEVAEDNAEIQPEPDSTLAENDSSSSATKHFYSDPESENPIFSVLCEGGWIDLKNLDPRVVELIYWRDVKKTGVIFGSVLVILLSLSYFSLLSVLAYLSLAVLCVTFTFRLYKNVLQVVQKSNDGHPFKPYLEKDLTIPEDKVQQATEVLIKHVNCVIHELRRLFLVEDLAASIKFGILLWVLTYIGALFNGMTLVILAFVALFTLPKVYETYKTQIDHYLLLAHTQINNVIQQIKAKIPVGKKEKAQ